MSRRVILTLALLSPTLANCANGKHIESPKIVAVSDPCVTTLIASGLLKATPGIPLPKVADLDGMVDFADKQTGQLDKSNKDKKRVLELLKLQCKDYVPVVEAKTKE